MSKVTVLITGVGAKSVGGQLVTCLKKYPDRYRIIGTDVNEFSSGLFEADKGYLIPPANDPEFISTLLEIALKENVRIILPGSHPEVVVLAENITSFLDKGIEVIISPKELVALVDDKITQYQYLQAFGFRVPRFFTIRQNLPSKLPFGFPMIVKPSNDVGGSKNVYIAGDRSELQQIINQFDITKTSFLIQEIIGDPEHEYTVGVLYTKTGEPIDAIVLKRRLHGLGLLLQRKLGGKKYAISSGYTQGEVVEDKKIKDYCIAVGKKLGVTGPFNVQLRTDPQGVAIFEIHTRFSGSSPLRADVGFNEPDILIRNYLFNEQFSQIPYQTDVAIIRKFENIIVPKAKLESLQKKGFTEKNYTNSSFTTKFPAKNLRRQSKNI